MCHRTDSCMGSCIDMCDHLVMRIPKIVQGALKEFRIKERRRLENKEEGYI